MFKTPKNIKIAVAIGVLLIVIIAYRLLKPSMAPPQDIKVVEVEMVTKKDISQGIKLTGKIKAKYSTILTARAPGILNIIVPAGMKVTKDSLIAKVNSNEIEKRYTLCSSAEIIAKEQYDRAKNLLKSGAYSKAELEAIMNKWIITQKDLADAKIAFDKLQFYAPFDGIIGSYKLREGAQLKGDEQIVSFYDPSNVTLEFDIPSSVMAYINNGQNLSIDGKKYQLTHVQKMLDDEKHMSPASVDIICEDCLIGSNLDVGLAVRTKKNVIVIPFEAVFLRDGQPSVYVVKDNRLALRKIEMGLRDKKEVEIISGLEVGEVIVAKSTNRLYPAASVRIHEIANAAN